MWIKNQWGQSAGLLIFQPKGRLFKSEFGAGVLQTGVILCQYIWEITTCFEPCNNSVSFQVSLSGCEYCKREKIVKFSLYWLWTPILISCQIQIGSNLIWTVFHWDMSKRPGVWLSKVSWRSWRDVHLICASTGPLVLCASTIPLCICTDWNELAPAN